ncbi:MAG: type II toxin-antitoxin system VapC family toxin [Gemmatimonadota bacterium]
MTADTAYLFDADAISEPLKKRPLLDFLEWLLTVPRERQFTSAVVIGELFAGAYRQQASARHLGNIEERVLGSVTVIPYGADVARVYGRLSAELQDAGAPLAVSDLQIAATALHHDLELVSGNIRHFQRVPGLRLCHALTDARSVSPM